MHTLLQMLGDWSPSPKLHEVVKLEGVVEDARQSTTGISESQQVNISGSDSSDTGNNDLITAGLIGKKMEIACLIEGVEVKMLWDTGAQVSLISESWLQENFLPTEYTIRPVSELIDGEELSIEGAVAGSAIPYIGYTPLSFQLGRVQRQQLLVPFLVTTAKTSIPIVGSNEMQAVININNSTDLSLIKLTELGLNTDEVMAIKTVMHHQEEEHER